MQQGESMGDSDVITGEQEAPVDGSTMLDLSDDELIENTRAGSIAAFEELWQRHSVFGLIAAQAESETDADEINTQAWERIQRDISNGREKHTAFRPYLYSTVREEATGHVTEEDTPNTRMAEAFSTLPVRWQEILWYLDVEKMDPDDVVFLTNTDPDSISSTQSRARRGLTSAWMQTNAEHADNDDCRWAREHGRAFMKKTLPQSDAAAVEQHLASCRDCRMVFSTARSMGSQAPKLLLAAMAGTTAAPAIAAYLDANGPIIINEDPLPEPIVDSFFALSPSAPSEPPQPPEPPVSSEIAPAPDEEPPIPPEQLPSTYAEQEHRRRRKGALWIAIGIAIALIAAIIIIAMLVRSRPTPAPPASSTPAVETTAPSMAPTTSTPAPTHTPTPSETPSAQPTEEPPSAPPSEEPSEQPAPNPPAPNPPPPANNHPVASITSINTGPLGVLYPQVSGTAQPGDTVTVEFSNTSLTTVADARGNWSVTPTENVPGGTQSVTARAGLNPAPVTMPFTSVDPPRIVVASTPQGVTTTIRGVPGATVQIFIDQGSAQTVTLDASGTYSNNQKPISGSHVISVRYYGDGRPGPGTFVRI